MTPDLPPSIAPQTRRRAPAVVWLVLTVCVALSEVLRWLNPEERAAAFADWLCGVEADALPFLPWLLLAPVAWWGLARRRRAPDAATADPPRPRPLAQILGASLFFLCGAGASWWAGEPLVGLPPAYHDEFSYLLQAGTFAAGRTSYPSYEPAPELFDQMHVLNEGRFASRYFPGQGLWLAPFVKLGDPWRAQHVAHGLISAFLFLAGCELGGLAVGGVAAGWFLLSPGPLLFSTLLLAHHATLIGLSLFLWAYMLWRRTGRCSLLWLAGGGLAWAMICRPMTAAGFALPMGIDFAWWWLAGDRRAATATSMPDWKRRTLSAIVLATPLVVGLGILVEYNRAVTGSRWVSPYQLYTDVYTPRHVFGFNNVVRGERAVGPKTLENYDRWAENLTPALAVRNVQRRLVQSLRWSGGVVPLLAGALVCLMPATDRRWWLIVASILSLHAAHVPYWFEGIMGWHYVFESSVCWALLLGGGAGGLWTIWRREHRWLMIGWGSGLLATAIAVNLWTVSDLWPGRLPRGLAETAFSRRRYADFFQHIEQLRGERTAIVIVRPDPADRHMDYVVNSPDLAGPVLIARLGPQHTPSEIQRLFPERIGLLFDAREQRFERLPAVDSPTRGAGQAEESP